MPAVTHTSCPQILGDREAVSHLRSNSNREASIRETPLRMHVALLTGGNDRPYALGMAQALAAEGVRVDYICSDDLEDPALGAWNELRVLNLRGDQSEDAPIWKKAARISAYYARLVRYAVIAEPAVFHILWNNRFELVDRTLLMAFYRLFGRRVVLTAHNVNAARRDGRDSWLNRLTLRVQYRLCSHILVHTRLMKEELANEFGISPGRVTVIPFGINNTIPVTGLTRSEARRQLGLDATVVTLLFFGQIAPYKGLEYLVDAFARVARARRDVRLLIAGKVKRGHSAYWSAIRAAIASNGLQDRVVVHEGFIPDEQVERYFKAADVVMLPYVAIFQSGVPFLAYNFGVPVIATDVGSLREDVVDGVTGYVCEPRDTRALEAAIQTYLDSDLHRRSGEAQKAIKYWAHARNSWKTVGELSVGVYESLQ